MVTHCVIISTFRNAHSIVSSLTTTIRGGCNICNVYCTRAPWRKLQGLVYNGEKYNLAGWLFLLSVGRSFVGWTRCLIFWWCMEKENTHTRIHFVGGAVQSQWKKWKERKIGTAGGRHFGKQKER
jgi:hypothetical protein